MSFLRPIALIALTGLACATTAGGQRSLKLFRCDDNSAQTELLAPNLDAASCEEVGGFCAQAKASLDRCKATLRSELPQRGVEVRFPFEVSTDASGIVTAICMGADGPSSTPRTLGCILRALEQGEFVFPQSQRQARWPVTLSTQ